MKPGHFKLLCSAGLFAIFSSTISKSPVLPLFASYLGADPSGVGMIAAVSAFTGIVFSVPSGALSDKFGRKRVLVFSAVILSTAPLLYLMVAQLWQLALVRLYHGIATAIFIPVAMALISDLFQFGRAEKLGWFSSSTLIGRFAAPIAGGGIIGALALHPGIGYKVVYLVCWIAGLVALLLVFKIPASPGTESGRRPREMAGAIKAVLTNKGIVVTSSVEAAMLFSYGAFETFLPLYSIAMGVAAYKVGILISAQVITVALVKPVMGRLSDKQGRELQISLGALISALCIGSIPFLESFISLLAASILFGIGLSIVTSATAAFIADLSRRGTYGSAMGALGSIMDVGHMAGPLAVGFIIKYFGFGYAFAVASFVLVLAALVFHTSITSRQPTERTGQAPAAV